MGLACPGGNLSTSSLLGVWAAVRAGLGITVRCAGAIPADLCELTPPDNSLPDLGSVQLVLHRSATATNVSSVLIELLIEAAGGEHGAHGV